MDSKRTIKQKEKEIKKGIKLTLNTAKKIIKERDKAIKSGDTKEADRLYKQLIKITLDDAERYTKLAMNINLQIINTKNKQ